jgi:ABC-2 type transport system ATP-binding protein
MTLEPDPSHPQETNQEMSMNAAAALAVDEVSKRYGDFVAVDRVSFSVGPGTIFGLLGPNGAGKTSTIRMIMNITMPDSGRIEILGRPSTSGVQRTIGYLPEERGLYRKMKVLEHLTFLGEIRGLAPSAARQKAGAWLERMGLDEWKKNKIEDLSKGMQQKIQFIGCTIHDPELLILDEPFSGLDPVNGKILKDLIMEFRASGRTIIFSTHIMEQAEKMCDAIALINRSRVVLEGPLDEIKRRHSGNNLILTGRGDLDTLRGIAGVTGVTETATGADVVLVADFPVSRFIREAARLYEVESVTPHEASLHDIFVDVVGGDVDPDSISEKGVTGE